MNYELCEADYKKASYFERNKLPLFQYKLSKKTVAYPKTRNRF